MEMVESVILLIEEACRKTQGSFHEANQREETLLVVDEDDHDDVFVVAVFDDNYCSNRWSR